MPRVRSALLLALALQGVAPACDAGAKGGEAGVPAVDSRARVRVGLAESTAPRSRSRHLLLLEPQRRATLASRVGGQVKALKVLEQQSVSEGDALIEVADAELRGAYQSASAAVAGAREQLADIRRELAYAKKLQGRGAETARRVEQLASQVITLEAGLRQAQGSVIQAKDRKEGATIKAPFAGAVTQLHVEVGEYLAPGAPALVLSELAWLAVEVPLSEAEVRRHDAGEGLELIARVRGERVKSELEWVARESDQGTATFRARLKIVNVDGKLRAGESVAVEVLGPLDKPYLSVEAQALRWESDKPYLLRVDGEGLVRVDVTIVRDLGRRVAVEGELQEGQSFVTRGSATLVAGDSVLVVPSEAKAGG